MNTTDGPILTLTHVPLGKFVEFWSELYDYKGTAYVDNIGRPLDAERIVTLFTWKNGRTLSAKKKQTVLRFSSPDERIGHEAGLAALTDYLLRPGGVIWRVFWLHLQHPRHFPIYDQHVHRAMSFLSGRPGEEIPARKSAKVRAYLGEYRPFFDSFIGCESRQVDRALWTFGKYLSSPYGKVTSHLHQH